MRWECGELIFEGAYFRNFTVPLSFVCFVFPVEVPGEIDRLSFHNLCVHMQVNKTKIERNSSQEYYHMTCIGKTKHTSLRGPLFASTI